MAAVMRSNCLKPRGGVVRFLRAVVRAVFPRGGWSPRTTLVYDGGYASTDGRVGREDSRVVLSVQETDRGTVFVGHFDGMRVRNFHPVRDGQWEFRWEMTAADTVVIVYGFVANTGDGDETLYTHFRYTPAGDGGLPSHVYGEYRLRK